MRYIKTLLLLSFLSFSFHFISQTPTNLQATEEDSVFGYFLLVNSANPSKKIKIKDVGSYIITYNEKVSDTISTEKQYYVSGNIRDLNEKNILFDVKNETIEHNFKDGSTINSSNDFSSFYYSENEVPRAIPLNQILHFDYSSPRRALIHSFGKGAMIVSGALTLAFAPILSIEYSKKDGESSRSLGFNDKIYFNIAKTGILGYLIGYPISRFSRTKRYTITNDKTIKDSNFWYFEKQTEI